MILFFFALLLLIFGAFVFQLFLPPVLPLHGAEILFAPSLYFFGCLSLPFPFTLALTLYTGVLNDLFTVPQSGARHDFPTGISVLIYLVPGLIVHGFRPMFLRNRWETHCLLAEMCALLTPFILLAQYAILSFERGEIFYSDTILWRIIGPGLISLLLAPCVFFILTPLSHALGFRPGLPFMR